MVSMTNLGEKEFVSTEEDSTKLTGKDLTDLLNQIKNDWQVVDDHHLYKEFTFPDFEQALKFVNLVGDFAEKVNHHPNICFTWGKVEITLYTHEIGGLRESDFVYAAKLDAIFNNNF